VDTASKEISIIIPCYNEEGNIRACLDSLLDDFTKESCEIIVVDGMSTDGTAGVLKEYEEKYENLKVLSNPDRLQAHGLNIGIKNSHGSRIVRIDAHSLYPKEYVRRCVQLLDETAAENVGGVMVPVGTTAFEQAVGIAMRHPLGMRSAGARRIGFQGYVDSVYLGAFRRELFERVGYFDPLATPNEDGEMNLRIQKAGGKIFLDSSLEVQYRPRDSIRELARQYYRYGLGRGYTTLKHGSITAYRQLTPVPLVLGMVVSIVVAPLFIYSLIFPTAYLLGILGVSFMCRSAKGVRVKFLLSLSFVTIHLAYGIGFISRVFRPK